MAARRSFGIPALLGIATVTSFIVLRTIGTTLASEGVISAALASGSLLLLFASTGVLHLWISER